MILADKIIKERKRIGLSQEELAEKLDVSRQSVSKWEGAQSIPDIKRIIKMGEIFDVSTDYLLKDEMNSDNKRTDIAENVEVSGNLRKVNIEEASEFIRLRKQHAPLTAMGVSLCIWSPIILIVLAGFSESGILKISENMVGGIGIVALLSLITIAVVIFIKSENGLSEYRYLEKIEIETEYGVDGMAKEKRAEHKTVYNKVVIIGTILCILCPVPLLISSMTTEKDYILCSMVGVLLLIVGTAANLFVRVDMIKDSYDMLLQECNYTVAKKKAAAIFSRLSMIYWLSIVAIFLALSLPAKHWNTTWVIWPIAGVLYVVVINIAKLIIKAED